MICFRSLGYQAATFLVLAKIEALRPQNSRKWPFIEQYSVNLDLSYGNLSLRNGNLRLRNGILSLSCRTLNTRNHFFYLRFVFLDKRSHILDLSYDVLYLRNDFLDLRFRVFDTRNAVSNAFCRIHGCLKPLNVPMAVLCNSSHYFLITGKRKIPFELLLPVSAIRNCFPFSI